MAQKDPPPLEELCLGEVFLAARDGSPRVGRDPKVRINGYGGSWGYFGYVLRPLEGHFDFDCGREIWDALGEDSSDGVNFAIRIINHGTKRTFSGPYIGVGTSILPEEFVKLDYPFQESAQFLLPKPDSTVFPGKCMYLYGENPNFRLFTSSYGSLPRRRFAHLREFRGKDKPHSDPAYKKMLMDETFLSLKVIEKVQPGDVILVRANDITDNFVNYSQPVITIRRNDNAYLPSGEKAHPTSVSRDEVGSLLINSLVVLWAEDHPQLGKVGVGFVQRHQNDSNIQYYKKVFLKDGSGIRGNVVDAEIRHFTDEYIIADLPQRSCSLADPARIQDSSTLQP